MSNCCNTSCSSAKHAKKMQCPVCDKPGNEVSQQTITQHISSPWKWKPTTDRFFFCDNANCKVTYFGDDDSTINMSQLRTLIGIKHKSEDALICYCYGVTRQIAKNNPQAKAFVIEQTKNKHCDCVNRNPSGQCCLKDFPDPIL